MRKECIIQWKRFKHLKEKNDRTWREGEGKIGRVNAKDGERGEGQAKESERERCGL